MRSILLCGLGLILYAHNYAQYLQSFDLDIKGDPIDLIELSNDDLHLVTTTSVYLFSNGQLIHKCDHPTMFNHRQSWSDSDPVFLYYDIYESGYRIDNRLKYIPVSDNFNNGNFMWGNDYIIYTHKEVEYLSLEKAYTLKEFEEVSSLIWKATLVDDIPYLATESKGVFKLDTIENKLVKMDRNWFSDHPTSLGSNGDSLFVGFKGGYSILSKKGMQSFDLTKWIGKAAVLKFVVDEQNIYILTPETIIASDDGNHSKLPIDIKNGDEFVDIIVGKRDQIVVLTKEQILVLNTDKHLSFTNLSDSDQAINLYKIRDRIYYSDKNVVKKFNPYTQSWILNPNKIPPAAVFTDSDQNSFLVFDDTAIHLDKNDASLKGKWQLPQESILQLVEAEGEKFLCTESNLYLDVGQSWLKLNSVEDSFLNVIPHSSGLYALTPQTLYSIESEGLKPVKAVNDLSYHYNGRYSIQQNGIMLGTESGILLYNTANQSAEIIYRSKNILDFLEHNDFVSVLKPKSLITLSIASFNIGDPQVMGIKTFEEPLSLGFLYSFNDGNIWISSNADIFRFDFEDLVKYEPNGFYLDIIESSSKGVIDVSNANTFFVKEDDLPLKLIYNHNRYRSGDDSYKFHIGSDNNKETQWSGSSTFVFDQQDAGVYYIQAEMIDGMINSTVMAAPIQIHLLKPTRLNGTKVLIVTLCALLLMFLIVRGINR